MNKCFPERAAIEVLLSNPPARHTEIGDITTKSIGELIVDVAEQIDERLNYFSDHPFPEDETKRRTVLTRLILNNLTAINSGRLLSPYTFNDEEWESCESDRRVEVNRRNPTLFRHTGSSYAWCVARYKFFDSVATSPAVIPVVSTNQRVMTSVKWDGQVTQIDYSRNKQIQLIICLDHHRLLSKNVSFNASDIMGLIRKAIDDGFDFVNITHADKHSITITHHLRGCKNIFTPEALIGYWLTAMQDLRKLNASLNPDEFSQVERFNAASVRYSEKDDGAGWKGEYPNRDTAPFTDLIRDHQEHKKTASPGVFSLVDDLIETLDEEVQLTNIVRNKAALSMSSEFSRSYVCPARTDLIRGVSSGDVGTSSPQPVEIKGVHLKQSKLPTEDQVLAYFMNKFSEACEANIDMSEFLEYANTAESLLKGPAAFREAIDHAVWKAVNRIKG